MGCDAGIRDFAFSVWRGGVSYPASFRGCGGGAGGASFSHSGPRSCQSSHARGGGAGFAAGTKGHQSMWSSGTTGGSEILLGRRPVEPQGHGRVRSSDCRGAVGDADEEGHSCSCSVRFTSRVFLQRPSYSVSSDSTQSYCDSVARTHLFNTLSWSLAASALAMACPHYGLVYSGGDGSLLCYR